MAYSFEYAGSEHQDPSASACVVSHRVGTGRRRLAPCPSGLLPRHPYLLFCSRSLVIWPPHMVPWPPTWTSTQLTTLQRR